MNVNDSDQPKAPRFQHPCETAFITNVINDDLEGVPSVQSLVKRRVILWGHRRVANLHFSS